MVWTVLLWVSELLTFSVHMFLGLCGLFDLCVMYLGECVQPDRVCVCVTISITISIEKKYQIIPPKSRLFFWVIFFLFRIRYIKDVRQK